MVRLLALVATIACACVTLAAQADIEFSRVGDLSLRLDAYPATGTKPSPAVVLVHGGAWIKGDRRRNIEPLVRPLTDAGIAAFSISYRFAPDYLYPAAVEDVREAVRFVRRNAGRFQIDPGRVAVLGESAGAHLAALAVLDGNPDAPVRGVVSLYGPTDFVRLATTSSAVPEELRRAARDSAWGALLLGGLQAMSPVSHVRSGMPPFLFVHGTDDSVVPLDQSTAMCDAIRKAGSLCEVLTVEGGGHGLRDWETDPRRAAYKAGLIAWLQARLK